MLLVAFGIGGVAAIGLRDTGFATRLLDAPQAVSTAPVYSRSFPVCAGSVRVTCVVDGDTFWLDGVKYRIADINTPEVGQPSCAAEASLGRRATSRLAELLGAGPFSLAHIDRDEDQYGRKLRLVERDGRSIGPILVAEGLAHEWRGRRESWC
ncbi:MAG: thermonuclease family protein [Devosia sp.]|nr:MAG: thermonuclease family protein [Devosia sp.]